MLQVQSGEKLDSLCHILLCPNCCIHLLWYSAHFHTVSTIFLLPGWALNFILRHHPKSMLKIILTLVTLQGGMLARLPNVSYLTFFSYWSIFCIMPIYSMVWQWTFSNTVGDISMEEKNCG